MGRPFVVAVAVVLLAACGKSEKSAPAASPPPADAAAPPIDAAPVPGTKVKVRLQETPYASETLVEGDALWMPSAKLLILATKGAVACPPAKPKEYGPDDIAIAFQLDDEATLGSHTARNQWNMKAASGGIMDVSVTITGLDPLTGSVRAGAIGGDGFFGEFVAPRCDPPPE